MTQDYQINTQSENSGNNNNHTGNSIMRVQKRDGSYEPVNVSKIVKAIQKHSGGLHYIDPMLIATKTISGLYNGTSTQELDKLAIRTASTLMVDEPQYSKLAARLLTTYIDKEVKNQDIYSFSQCITIGYELGLFSEKVYTFVKTNARKLNSFIDPARNDLFEYFGVATLYDRYLTKHSKTRKVIETPQYFWLRVACGLSDSINQAKDLYTLFSSLEYIPSSPTLFNSGTVHEQMSSCYLLDSPEDSLDGIYEKYHDIARLSKYAGGIGVSFSRVRSKNSRIDGTNGISNGIVPFLKTLDSSVLAVNQGSRRKGAACVYLETWHADIEQFLELRDNTGDESRRTYNLNLANWIPDIFMRRVESDDIWSLFDPKDVPRFPDTYGSEFEELYLQAESEKKYVKQLRARDLYGRMMRTLAQTGNGWMCFKDSSNRKCNQIASKPTEAVHLSNLCVAPETLVLTDRGNIPICELEDQEVTVWNGYEWSKVTVRKTGVNQELCTVRLRYGFNGGFEDVYENYEEIECTPYHKFILDSGERVPAEKLQPGSVLHEHNLPDGKCVSHTVVVEVMCTHRKSDTFCFTEPLRNTAVFNGIMTGNCTEIIELNDTDQETSVCNLGSINLSQYVDVEKQEFDFDKLSKNVQLAVRQLDTVIDRNFYPIESAETSNKKWRPVGLGLMGLQDVFFQLGYNFDSKEALDLSTKIQEYIYYNALVSSCALAQEKGRFPNWENSRTAQGKLQFDLWVDENPELIVNLSPELDWAGLRKSILKHGLRNSLLIAIAPTATIASIAGCYECIEPQISNLFKRESLSGEFIQVNRYLVNDLRKIGLWTQEIRNSIKLSDGSIQNIDKIPNNIRERYKTVWEISMKVLIELAANRGLFVDQSQSLNIFLKNPNIAVISSVFWAIFRRFIKTSYYLRSRGASEVMKTTVSGSNSPQAGSFSASLEKLICSLENPENCEACQ